jgi:uncharacterized membrane protein (DUF106 family)
MNEEYKHKTSKTLKLLFKYYKYEHNRNNKYMFYMWLLGLRYHFDQSPRSIPWINVYLICERACR